jgi:hypothetical protein
MSVTSSCRMHMDAFHATHTRAVDANCKMMYNFRLLCLADDDDNETLSDHARYCCWNLKGRTVIAGKTMRSVTVLVCHRGMQRRKDTTTRWRALRQPPIKVAVQSCCLASMLPFRTASV